MSRDQMLAICIMAMGFGIMLIGVAVWYLAAALEQSAAP